MISDNNILKATCEHTPIGNGNSMISWFTTPYVVNFRIFLRDVVTLPDGYIKSAGELVYELLKRIDSGSNKVEFGELGGFGDGTVTNAWKSPWGGNNVVIDGYFQFSSSKEANKFYERITSRYVTSDTLKFFMLNVGKYCGQVF